MYRPRPIDVQINYTANNLCLTIDLDVDDDDSYNSKQKKKSRIEYSNITGQRDFLKTPPCHS